MDVTHGWAIVVAAAGTLLLCGCPTGPTEANCVPSAELCDGIDNDCDGAVDQGLADLTCGQGICVRTVSACTAGTAGSCVPGTPAAAEGCNGVDDDCDGSVDEGCSCTDGNTQACFAGAPANRGVGECHDGTQRCLGGQWGDCVGQQLPVTEVCNGKDDDCDGTHDEDDPGGGGTCDTGLVGLCRLGTLHCVSGAPACEQTVQPVTELCNGLDDDCDGAVDEEDPGGGAACDGPDADLCAEGVLHCVSGALVCNDVTGDTLDLCNGVDDDCDPASPDGSEDPDVGAACDGLDSDLCLEGTRSCVSGALACSDATGSTLDLCNGVDDDCDPASPDGSEDPTVGAACDGLDSDLCLEGTYSCVSGALACSDATGDTLDLCNGVDDDCDPASPDGSEDPTVGAACDGLDSDLCLEGTYACVSGALACNDATGDTLDLCNGVDDDCDPASPDGSEDPTVGTACDGPDTDLCAEGTWSCVSGALACSDTTDSSVELCNGLDDDCDGTIDEGLVLDGNPVCGSFPDALSVSGDLGADRITRTAYGEAWFSVVFTENDDLLASTPLTGTILLRSPVGSDYDLVVYCTSCAGTLAGSSNVHGQAREDRVDVRAEDVPLATTSLEVIVGIVYFSSSQCGLWELEVQGHTDVATTTCF